MNNIDKIKSLPIWTGPIEISPLEGGITNFNYLVKDSGKDSVVRMGSDIPCLLYTSPSPRDRQKSRMPSSA